MPVYCEGGGWGGGIIAYISLCKLKLSAKVEALCILDFWCYSHVFITLKKHSLSTSFLPMPLAEHGS